MRRLLALVVVSMILAAGVGAADPHQSRAQDGATATISALQTQVAEQEATIQVLQTQVARLQPTSSATPSSEEEAGEGLSTAEEFVYEGQAYQIGEAVSAIGAVDITVTGAQVFNELEGVNPDGEFLVVYM